MLQIGEATNSGDLGIRVFRQGVPWPTEGPISYRDIIRLGLPQPGLSRSVNLWRLKNIPNLIRGLRRVVPARAMKLPHFYGELFITVIRANGKREDLGLASLRVVTTAGVVYVCADMAAGANDINLFKFHGMGTGGTAEAAGDTALVTESTTALNPDSTRATGSQAQGTSGANATYTTVGTLTVDAAVACTEHGLFTQAATGGGTLFDRSLFSVVNLANGDSIQFTYVFTLNSGG